MRPIWLSLVALTLLAPTATAQMPRMIHFGIAGGVSVPVNHVKDTLKQGYALQGMATLTVPVLPIGFGASINYQKFDGKETIVTSAGRTSTIVSGLGTVQLHLLKLGPIRPYVSAGLGAYSVGSKNDSLGVETTNSEVHFGINGAAGTEVHFSRNVWLYIEARMDNVYTDKGVNSQLQNTKTIQFLPVVIGLMF